MTSVDPVSAPAFLDIAHSALGRKWVERPADDRQTRMMMQRLHLPEVVCRVLAGRNVTADTAPTFLAPSLREQLPDPSHLLDMDAAAERLAQAIADGQTIAVYGDYDVDGATSTALLIRFLRAAGADPQIYIPDRLSEGYGPNAAAMVTLRQRGVQVVVTVDCGITAFVPLAAAAEQGLEVIVIDHHEAEEALPPGRAVVNPKRRDELSPHKHLAAVGVTFLLVVATNRLLRGRRWYGETRPEPVLMDWLDIVALGTVCDVVPLVGVNRALVTQGLKVMAKRRNAGLAALADVAGVKEVPDAYHLGYVLGPRVNAGGRVGECDLGARLLACDDPEEAAGLALRLHEYNMERQEVEAAVLFEAIEQAEAMVGDPAMPLLLLAGDGWHPGVIGIVAGRLKERYGLPTCVVAVEGGMAKGSGRSVPGVDLGRAVIAAREAGLLFTGGGHAMAAGFSLDSRKLADFRQFLCQRIQEQIAGGGIAPTLEVDGAVDISEAAPELLAKLALLGPYGASNDEPRFVVPSLRVVRSDVVGSGHVRCTFTGGRGGRLKGIAFKSADSELGMLLLRSQGQSLHVAGTLRADNWQGREGVQLVIDDAALAR